MMIIKIICILYNIYKLNFDFQLFLWTHPPTLSTRNKCVFKIPFRKFCYKYYVELFPWMYLLSILGSQLVNKILVKLRDCIYVFTLYEELIIVTVRLKEFPISPQIEFIVLWRIKKGRSEDYLQKQFALLTDCTLV